MVKVGSTYNVNANILVVSVQKVPVKDGSLYRYSVAIMGMGTGEVYSSLAPEEVAGFGFVSSKNGLKLGLIPVEINSGGKEGEM